MSPHPAYDDLVNRLQSCLPLAISWSGTVVRATNPQWASDEHLLRGEGTMKSAGRWNPAGIFRAVYMSNSSETALAESLSRQRYYQLPEHDALPLTLVAIQVSFYRIISLRDRQIRRKLELSVSEMIELDWRAANSRGEEVITQALSRAAFASGIEGLLLPSAARRRGGFNLLWFPAHLDSKSTVSIVKGIT